MYLFFAEDASMSETKHKSLLDQLAINSVIKQQEVKRLWLAIFLSFFSPYIIFVVY